jgi:hypothetical protein
MRQIQIKAQGRKRPKPDIDTRTPSGRTLPY